MDVIPALDLMGNQAVRLLQGRRDARTVLGDPLQLARKFVEEGAPRIHVVDLDGAFDGAPRHLDLVRELAGMVHVQYGGGLRRPADVVAALMAGVHQLVLGTAAIEDPALLGEVPRDRLIVGVDIKDGRVAVRGWTEVADWKPRDLCRRLQDLGVQRVMTTAVHRDGTLSGPDLGVIEQVCIPGMGVLASGGVATVEHIRSLKSLGCEGVIIGKALLQGTLALDEARAAAS